MACKAITEYRQYKPITYVLLMPPTSEYRGMGPPAARPAKSVLGPSHPAQKLNGSDTKTRLSRTINDVMIKNLLSYRYFFNLYV